MRHVWNIWNIANTLTRPLTLPLALTLTRYAHVWNIVAQPDGTFHWLQSFINHYSLPSWLRQSDARSERHVSHTGLEPQTSRPQAGLLLTRLSLTLTRHRGAAPPRSAATGCYCALHSRHGAPTPA